MLELGRQGRLKICWAVMSVWVRVPLVVLNLLNCNFYFEVFLILLPCELFRLNSHFAPSSNWLGYHSFKVGITGSSPVGVTIYIPPFVKKNNQNLLYFY